MAVNNGHLHFVQSLETLRGGGLATSVVEMHESMKAQGLNSRVVSTYGDEKVEAGSGVLEFQRFGYYKMFYSPELHKQASVLVSEASFVHAHGFYVATNWLLGRAAIVHGRGLVYHAHGFLQPTILQRSRFKKAIAHFLFENRNFSSANLWRALTVTEAEQIRAQGITAPIVVAPNGIDLTPFDDTSLDSENVEGLPPKQRRRLLFLGRLHPVKGLELLISAWAKVAMFHSAWELVIVGPDDNGYLARLQYLVRSLDLEQSVAFVEAVRGADKIATIKSADMFILPSYTEGFSMAILESLACRVPVIASVNCNFPELAVDGGGWICEASVESITSSLFEAFRCTDSELVERGETGRSLVEKSYTWSKVVTLLNDACESMITTRQI